MKAILTERDLLSRVDAELLESLREQCADTIDPVGDVIWQSVQLVNAYCEFAKVAQGLANEYALGIAVYRLRSLGNVATDGDKKDFDAIMDALKKLPQAGSEGAWGSMQKIRTR